MLAEKSSVLFTFHRSRQAGYEEDSVYPRYTPGPQDRSVAERPHGAITYRSGENISPLSEIDGLLADSTYLGNALYVPDAVDDPKLYSDQLQATPTTESFTGALHDLRETLRGEGIPSSKFQHYLQDRGYNSQVIDVPGKRKTIIAERSFGPILTKTGAIYTEAQVYLATSNGKTIVIIEEPIQKPEGRSEREASWIILSGSSTENNVALADDSVHTYYATSDEGRKPYLDLSDWNSMSKATRVLRRAAAPNSGNMSFAQLSRFLISAVAGIDMNEQANPYASLNSQVSFGERIHQFPTIEQLENKLGIINDEPLRRPTEPDPSVPVPVWLRRSA